MRGNGLSCGILNLLPSWPCCCSIPCVCVCVEQEAAAEAACRGAALPAVSFTLLSPLSSSTQLGGGLAAFCGAAGCSFNSQCHFLGLEEQQQLGSCGAKGFERSAVVGLRPAALFAHRRRGDRWGHGVKLWPRPPGSCVLGMGRTELCCHGNGGWAAGPSRAPSRDQMQEGELQPGASAATQRLLVSPAAQAKPEQRGEQPALLPSLCSCHALG